MKPINVGLLGIGTVGGGTFSVLERNREEITRRAGRPIRISVVADKNAARAQEITQGKARIVDDAFAVVADPEVDIVVELIGGCGVARKLVMQAIANGKHVVTANKALLATHGNEIFKAAQEKGVMVAFEAAVAGGVPIIKALREGLTANRIEWIAGIINGTSNFILSRMRETGASFETVLAEAQALGYAESDPTYDVEGIDAAHKLAIIILDEVKTGFRIANGGAQEAFGIHPDLATYAKAMGNGYPIAALGGKAEIMSIIGHGVAQG